MCNTKIDIEGWGRNIHGVTSSMQIVWSLCDDMEVTTLRMVLCACVESCVRVLCTRDSLFQDYFDLENLPLECMHLTYINIDQNLWIFLKFSNQRRQVHVYCSELARHGICFLFVFFTLNTYCKSIWTNISPFIVVTSIDPLTNQYNKNKTTGSKHFLSLILKMTGFSFPSHVGMHHGYPSSQLVTQNSNLLFSSFVVGLHFFTL